MSVLATALDPGNAVLAEGILDWTNRKGTETQDTMRIVASVVAVGFVIFVAVKSRGAMAAILMSGFAAGIFLWIVFNVTQVKDKIGEEVDDAPQAAGVVMIVDLPDPIGDTSRV